jgi:CheY-like chemotaxis protein
LVVDDEMDARDLIRLVLESQGAHVETVASAGEALHALSQRTYDVILADIGMPGRDGYSLIEAVRLLPRHQGGEIPAIAVTAYASIRERDQALAAGFNWHVPKPVDPHQLAATVVSAVRPTATASRHA